MDQEWNFEMFTEPEPKNNKNATKNKVCDLKSRLFQTLKRLHQRVNEAVQCVNERLKIELTKR